MNALTTAARYPGPRCIVTRPWMRCEAAAVKDGKCFHHARIPRCPEGSHDFTEADYCATCGAGRCDGATEGKP